jgi:hypothetical protein
MTQTSTTSITTPFGFDSGGRYFEDCNEAVPVQRRGEPGRGGVAPYALDLASAERLWDVSLGLIG